MKELPGVYVHVPFCEKKCPYCNFFSEGYSGEKADLYTRSLIGQIKEKSDKNLAFDSIYFGGGTPALLGSEKIAPIIETLRESFCISAAGEITIEINPSQKNPRFFSCLRRLGFNRLSVGAQSGNVGELISLGRRHTADDVADCVKTARGSGFDNISLDIMLGVPGQTTASLGDSLELIKKCSPEHISAYILKIEEETPFGRCPPRDLPDEDGAAELYLSFCEGLDRLGYRQYEISNFSKPGRESRHNLKYWKCGEYLGFGPAAHSFFAGRRFFYEDNLEAFLLEPKPIDDGEGGTREETAMLLLRLAEGITRSFWREKFGEDIPLSYIENAQKLEKTGLCIAGQHQINLTRRGFLVSNDVISRIIL